MMRFFQCAAVAISTCVALPITAQAQNATTSSAVVAQLRYQYTVIQKELPRYTKFTADGDSLGIERRSTDGTQVDAYCKSGALRMVEVTDFGEHGNRVSRYYWWNDEMFFANVVTQQSDKLYGPPVRTTVEKLYFKDADVVNATTTQRLPAKTKAASLHMLGRTIVTDAESFFAALVSCNGERH